MNRTRLILLLGVLCACLPGPATAADFTLFFSGDVGGELEPCG